MVATLEDFRRIWALAQRPTVMGTPTHEIVRVSLHSTGFTNICRLVEFVRDPTRARAGWLWNVPVYNDSRFEQGVAYVVTRSLSRGVHESDVCSIYPLELPPEPARRTSWDLILEELV